MTNFPSHVRMKRRVRCGKCGQPPYVLIETWNGHGLHFDYDGQQRSAEGICMTGDPAGVIARCECGHSWALRGITQITDLDRNKQ